MKPIRSVVPAEMQADAARLQPPKDGVTVMVRPRPSGKCLAIFEDENEYVTCCTLDDGHKGDHRWAT